MGPLESVAILGRSDLGWLLVRLCIRKNLPTHRSTRLGAHRKKLSTNCAGTNSQPTENPLAGCRQVVERNLVAGASEIELAVEIEHSEMMLEDFALLGSWLDLEVVLERTLHT